MTQPNLVVYDDSAVFGGHEVMTLAGVHALLTRGVSVRFAFAESNEKLGSELQGLKQQHAGLVLSPLPWSSRKPQGVRTRISVRQVRGLSELLQRWAPQALLVAQGNIELSSLALVAGKSIGLRTVSYIPLPHTQEQMGARFGAVRDLFNRYLFNLPDAFITISHELVAGFRDQGSRVPIDVVYNGIEAKRFDAEREPCRARLGLPKEGYVIGLAGRLERHQKGQLFLIDSLRRSAWLQQNVTLVLAGTGPDEALLRKEVAKAGLKSRVRFPGWCQAAELYPALDALVIASRFEGMPLVMLEALASRVPVVSTDRDGMRELLPSDWRFQAGDHQGLALTLRRVLTQPNPQKVEALRNRVLSEMSIESFHRQFASTVGALCGLELDEPEGEP